MKNYNFRPMFHNFNETKFGKKFLKFLSEIWEKIYKYAFVGGSVGADAEEIFKNLYVNCYLGQFSIGPSQSESILAGPPARTNISKIRLIYYFLFLFFSFPLSFLVFFVPFPFSHSPFLFFQSLSSKAIYTPCRQTNRKDVLDYIIFTYLIKTKFYPVIRSILPNSSARETKIQ